MSKNETGKNIDPSRAIVMFLTFWENLNFFLQATVWALLDTHPNYGMCLTANQKTPTLVTFITTVTKERCKVIKNEGAINARDEYLEALIPLTTAHLEITNGRKIQLGAFRNSLAHLFLPAAKDQNTIEILKLKATTELVEDRLAFTREDIIKATEETHKIIENLQDLMEKHYPAYFARLAKVSPQLKTDQPEE
ncbi:MAG: hypothetical protein IIA70_01045 [Proteobacteria bacterium]|nr:hypothetical protein [Pseudomonadota bacterium]